MGQFAPNHLAIVGRNIAQWKACVYDGMAEDENTDWAKYWKAGIDALNENPSGATLDIPPGEVKENKALQFELQQEQAEN